MRPGTRAAGVLAAAAVLGLVTAPAAMATRAADRGDVDVVNTETVQIYLSPEGDVESRRVYEQLTLTGNGAVDLANPVAPDGLRNLAGFGGLEVEGGHQVVEGQVDGSEQIRTVSDHTGDLPVTVTPTYRLDGQEIGPDDLVGRSGRLEVTFVVANQTSREQQITVTDGAGNEVTRTVRVPVPLVGSLATTLPAGFTRVEPNGASTAGDGKGGTKLSYTMTLFPPLGSDTAELTYAATVEDAVVPQVDVTLLPIDPFANPTVRKAADSYDSGATTGAELVAGAGEIDTNLLKLRDGAAELLAGLVKLSDGAAELNSGLAGRAGPGSRQLADGAGELDNGLGDLLDGTTLLAGGAAGLSTGTGDLSDGADLIADGAGLVADGAGAVADGAGQVAGGLDSLSEGTSSALAGGQSLTDGLGQISGGLGQLADQLPAAGEGITQLQAGIDQLVAGMGTADDPHTIIGGLAALETGLTRLQAGAGQLEGGLDQLDAGLGQVKGGLDGAKSRLDAKLAPGAAIDQLIGGLTTLAGLPSCSVDPQCAGLAGGLEAGAAASKADLQALSGGLGQLSGGLAQAHGALDTQLVPGAGRMEDGLGRALVGTDKLQGGADRVRGGLHQVDAGLTRLAAGVTAAVQGVLQLNAGAGSAYTGSRQLTSGLGRLDAGAGVLADGSARVAGGAGRLAGGAGDLANGAGALADGADLVEDGAGRLADGSARLAGGTGRAKDGSGRLAAGADELADGLGDAADGSGLLADGLKKAASGAPKLVEGAGRLSKEGMGALSDAGTETAVEYGTLSATIKAGAVRAEESGMAYGAPEGARGLTAYSFVLKGADGESTRNWARGLGAVVLMGLGGLVALRRRLV